MLTQSKDNKTPIIRATVESIKDDWSRIKGLYPSAIQQIITDRFINVDEVVFSQTQNRRPK